MAAMLFLSTGVSLAIGALFTGERPPPHGDEVSLLTETEWRVLNASIWMVGFGFLAVICIVAAVWLIDRRKQLHTAKL